MKDGLTTHVVLAAGPNLLGTFFKHYLTSGKNREDADGKDTARMQLMYDEVFELVQRVLYISTLHTADSLQKLCQQRTPVPPWVAMHRVCIPQITSKRAAEALVTALGGPEMAFKVAGGTKWWQVRAGNGVECEWLAMKKHYTEKKDRVPDDGDCGFVPEMDRLRCMLFVHGGGYYCGSINTHHYFIWRLAKKIRGRVLAVNYRMAPQYPFPCAIQDVLASYMYLIDPPEGAAHRPVDPKNIIVAGDSAGGGLSLVLLQILRDLNLPLPGGSILMSPWCDLTHSFPSVLSNTKTDVIPPYSFIHKPSSLWPPPPADMTHSMQTSIVSRVRHAVHGEREQNVDGPGSQAPVGETAIRTSDPRDLAKLRPFLEDFAARKGAETSIINPADKFAQLAPRGQLGPTTLASGDNSLRTKLDDKDIMIDTQIQLYATNAQLCHPYVSPVLGYFGGLPPMLVIAGDSEVLRDEVIYLAHKAANPSAYPVREDVRAMMPHWDGIEGRHQPTDVHLQVYDGVGHDIPLFCMTKPGHCAVRAIGAFARWVTPDAPGSLPATAAGTGVPGSGESSSDPSPVAGLSLVGTPREGPPVDGTERLREDHRHSLGYIVSEAPLQEGSTPNSMDYVDARLHELRLEGEGASTSPSSSKRPSRQMSWGGLPKASPGRAGWPGIYDGPNPFTDHMIRERVDRVGACRPLEPESQLSAMTMPAAEIGMIKTAAVMRYLEGQAKWDHKFAGSFKRVARHRARNLKRADKDAPKIAERWRRGSPSNLRPSREATPRTSPESTPEGTPRGSMSSEEDLYDVGFVAVDETWAWGWALEDERPPPSAIVSRRDLPEGRALALLADRIDAPGDSELNLLSVWVILAQLFSTGEKEGVEEARYMRDKARARKGKGKWRLFGRDKGKNEGKETEDMERGTESSTREG
ncbi:alpha/beta-hydrolase [Cutaneotrichosporon oleaginosum]|uniref:Alpha/beta-hydrolase n=1 Tax=Cutaneotrichosporon oleaginosum TaxID=879819 RepID=A0A0J1BBJ5_9TREE|nr:alpha/beta-hydrolase [Cutaneotrichosporon oleaginosum]KLT45379.1 alpha/beta-hydrolase [Cutaneotrichosporon oleaginosum]